MVSRGMTLAVTVAMLGGAGCRQLFGIADTEVDSDGAPADADVNRPDGRPDAKAGDVDGPPSPADAAQVVCPVEYLYAYGGHRYRYAGLNANWTTARDDCADDLPGTHLAIPDDPIENSQLSQWITQRTWIGISDVAVEGSLITVLGLPLSFDNWENGNPQNSASSDCVSMRDAVGTNPGTWRIESCGLGRPYVCECPGP